MESVRNASISENDFVSLANTAVNTLFGQEDE
jgi:hypothetical protein